MLIILIVMYVKVGIISHRVCVLLVVVVSRGSLFVHHRVSVSNVGAGMFFRVVIVPCVLLLTA